MRVFVDFEFNERGPQIPIQPISCGLVAENGRELYVINQESLSNLLRHPWLSVNVAPALPIRQDIPGPNSISEWDPTHPEYVHVQSLDRFREFILSFLRQIPNLELWSYYGAYDHVVLCQLFGSMAELPAGMPMWTHELMQEIERQPGFVLPPEPAVAHHALYDARWNAEVYQKLFPPPVEPEPLLAPIPGVTEPLYSPAMEHLDHKEALGEYL